MQIFWRISYLFGGGFSLSPKITTKTMAIMKKGATFLNSSGLAKLRKSRHQRGTLGSTCQEELTSAAASLLRSIFQ